MDEAMNTNEEKISEAFKKKIKVHLILTDKSFRNGIVFSIENGYFIFLDDVNGEEPIFFIELHNVKPYIREAKE